MMRWLLILMCTIVIGCSAELDDYHNTQPKFDLFGYFDGEVKAWGMVQDYSGKQVRRFTVQISGKVIGEQLTLTEAFLFDDGEESERIWQITRLKNGQYTGVADDIIGTATGKEVGNALRWQYDFELELDDATYTVFFDDWLYRQDQLHVFNITKMRKFGLQVGQITLFFQRQQ